MAGAGQYVELKGNQVQRLVFKLEDKGQYEQLERAKKEAAEKARREADEAASKAEEEASRSASRKRKSARRARRSRQRSERSRQKSGKHDSKPSWPRHGPRSKSSRPGRAVAGPTGMPSGFRTIELFGQINGQNVPLSQVLTEQGGGFAVVPGGAVLGGESPGEGFGYGGTPGRWAEASGGQPPTAYGQDATMGIVGFDGARAWPVPASTLAQIFGANWRGSLS
jgi:hypothetical protein